jgi:hypothetical protein
MSGLSNNSATPLAIPFFPMPDRSWEKYENYIDETPVKKENRMDEIFKEAEANSFDPVILKLLVREMHMSRALDAFLSHRLES